MKTVLLGFFFAIPSFLTLVSAHMPMFKDYNDCALTDLDIYHQSLGLYLKIPGLLSDEEGNSANCTFTATAAKEIAVSVSIPHGRYLKTDGDNLVVELTGANTSELSCEAGYNGWNPATTSFRRLLDLTLNQSAVLRTPKFESFGVGGYHPIAACNTTAVVSGPVSVVVTNNNDHDVYISIGIGTEEALLDMLFIHGWLMPFDVTKIWMWAGYTFLAVGVPLIALSFFFFLIRWPKTRPSFLPPSGNADWANTMAFTAGIFLSINSMQFIIRLLTLTDVEMGNKIAFPLIVHIIIPDLLALWFFGISGAIPHVFRWLAQKYNSQGDWESNGAAMVGSELIEYNVLLALLLYLGIFLWQAWLIPAISTLVFLILKTVEGARPCANASDRSCCGCLKKRDSYSAVSMN